jgi:hypothetical protein
MDGGVDMMLYLVYDSGAIEHLQRVTVEQAALFVQMYPKVHIFEGEEIA